MDEHSIFHTGNYVFESSSEYDTVVQAHVPYLSIWTAQPEPYRYICQLNFSYYSEKHRFWDKFCELVFEVDLLMDEQLFKYLLLASVEVSEKTRQHIENRITALI